MPTLIKLPRQRDYRGWKISSFEEGFIAVDPANRAIEAFPHWTTAKEHEKFIDEQITQYN